MSLPASFSAPARGLIVAAAIAVLIIVLQHAASLLTPVLLAVFIAVIATPPLRWMRRRGLPKWLALALVVFVLVEIGSLLAVLSTGALEGFRDSMPTYQERFLALSENLGSWLEGLGVEGSRAAIPDLLDPDRVNGLVRLMLTNAGSLVGNGLLVLLATVFILLEAPSLPAKLRAAFNLPEQGQQRLIKLVGLVNRYMLIKALTSLGTALLIGIWLWLLDLDFIVIWVLLAFLLNFVPVIGSWIMGIPAILLALVQADLQTAMLTALGYMIVNVGIGNIIEPRVMGHGLGISSLVVFLSLMFWGWLFGTVGVFLSVPLTMAVIIALDASPQTRPIAILLGPEIKAESMSETRAEP
ncbi:AI-2E family transporter [Thiohalocapsa marina]|uniref:AI-2E family transporter n=1 Tax=Thiohalocapsa marina TaxID=424902 RepID=A0A5M8FS07_9GAMM|nr:AI-2E family transporter [Thiohalocapsa marina]KAA6186661.1 AI-2E family transporter [Thiohalocapsa marina]